MNKQTLKITQGAMMVAIFGMLLLINRQTAGFFQGALFFVLPIPLVAYSAMYGWKPGLTVMVAMSLVSVVFGSVMSIFYSVTQLLTGLVFGGLLYKKVDPTKTLFAVMGISAVSSVLKLIYTALLVGYDMNNDVSEKTAIIGEVFKKGGMQLPPIFSDLNYMRQMFIISTIFWGMISGFCVYEFSFIILKRLKFPVQKPMSVYCYYPPRFLGTMALILFLYYNYSLAKPFENPILQNAIQTMGMVGFLYLIVFGVLGILLWSKKKFPGVKIAGIFFVLIGMMILPQITMFIGLFYSSFDLHEHLMRE